MSYAPLPLTGQQHNNQQLFSDHYLSVILPAHSDWQRLRNDASLVREQIAKIFARYLPSANEAQTEKDLVQPVLEALGHTFEIQTALRTPDGTKVPDYVFYWDNARRMENRDKTLDDELLKSRAFAVGDAKHWDRKLDVATRGTNIDPFSNRNPSYQIAFYMQHSGVDWGILTNGRLWRLYHKDTAHKLDRFYEIDLKALIDSGSIEQFLYFYAFFRRRAFDAHALGVTEILQASADYARAVGNSLKSQVFDSLRHIAQGFLDYPANQLQPD